MIILIGGPTASGKSQAALKIAKLLDGEIINGDAFQIYREMDIGTAKPSLVDRATVPHHLFDIRFPNEPYNIKDYQYDARNTIDDILKRKKVAIIVGGTALYQKAVLYDYEFKEEKAVDLSDLDRLSDQELYEYLKLIDPIASESIHQNNRKRVLRAIAIYKATGETKSNQIAKQKHTLFYDGVIMVGLENEREELYKKIDARVDAMIEDGLIEEVSNLLKKYGKGHQAFLAIGYKEIISYLSNECSKEEAIMNIKKHTRNYAKRQLTFFKNKFDMNWFNNLEDLENYIKERIANDR